MTTVDVLAIAAHRDDVELHIAGLPARTHASQGEQRSLALALRLASHHVITEVTGSATVLLLDDVFSELDPDRSDAALRITASTLSGHYAARFADVLAGVLQDAASRPDAQRERRT